MFDMRKPLRALDLFSGGAGGWTLGFHRAGIETVAACEADPWRRAVYSHNFSGVRIYDDVRTLSATRLAADGIVSVDIVCGSPPCQDASTANTKGRGIDGERTGLFLEAIRIVRELRPRWVAFENVPGLRARGADRVLALLEEAGYTAWPCVVGADDIGANHRRKRAWIIAADADRNAIRIEPGRSGGEDGTRAAEPRADAGRADMRAQHDLAEHGEVEREPNGDGTAGDSGRAGLEIGEGIGRDDGEERPSPVRAIMATWGHYNSGAVRAGRVDDGLPAALASRHGLGRACLAAYGDAVLPQITFAIGQTLVTLDRLLNPSGAEKSLSSRRHYQPKAE